MRRFLLFWPVLAAVQWAAGTALDFIGWRVFDWTFPAFAALVLVPAAQVAVLVALVPDERAVGLAAAWRASMRPFVVRVLVFADAALVAGGLLAPARSVWSAARPGGAIAAAASLQIGAAGLAAVALSAREGAAGERAIVGAAGVAALAAAVVRPFRLSGGFATRRAVALEAIGAGGLVTGVVLLLAAASVIERRHPFAGRALESTAAAPVAVSVIVLLAFFQFPRVAPPWDSVVRLLGLAGGGATLVAVLGAFRAPESAGARR